MIPAVERRPNATEAWFYRSRRSAPKLINRRSFFGPNRVERNGVGNFADSERLQPKIECAQFLDRVPRTSSV